MENAIKDFEDWVKTLVIPEVKYFAVFDPASGSVLGVYPDHSCPDTPNKIEVDEEISISIVEGKTNLNSYVVDLDSEKIEFVENKHLRKIDDVLHRVIEKRWSKNETVDIHLTVNKSRKKITIELDDKFYKSRKIFWDGSTEMLFLVTDYNDPNGLYDTMSTTVNKLFENRSLSFDVEFPEEFSVYTRRLFKNYVLTYEDN